LIGVRPRFVHSDVRAIQSEATAKNGVRPKYLIGVRPRFVHSDVRAIQSEATAKNGVRPP